MIIRSLIVLAGTLLIAVTSTSAWAQSFELFAKGLNKPVDFAPDPTDQSRFYVVEQTGTIRIIEDGELHSSPFFKARSENFTDKNWEQGLLGLAFDPKYKENKYFYVNYTGKGGVTHVSRFTALSPEQADPSSEKVIITIDQPFGNHNGGGIAFGPDGMLYIGMGDGGAANDPYKNGQNLESLLGKMLRIDVSSEPDEGKGYAIPSDNPFVDREGARGEIWAYGLRNPWRFSFDSKGRMWIGDVGQNRFEEINLQPEGSKGGENYGWSIMEGAGAFRPGGKKSEDPEALSAAIHRERGFEPPLWSYHQNPDGSVTGGFLYEGDDVPALKDRYIFAEFQRGNIWSFRLKDGKVDDLAEHTAAFEQALSGKGVTQRVSSFGRGTDGALYLLDHKGGAVYKIVK